MSKIPQERKVLYYTGIGMIVFGFILFFSVFFSVATGSGGFSSFARAPIGMVIIVIGGIVMNIGARGAAGSGIILDPDQAREDLKPYSEAAGGMINDVVSQVDAFEKFAQQKETPPIKEIVKIRCQECKSLNDEDAKFCKSCGKEL